MLPQLCCFISLYIDDGRMKLPDRSYMRGAARVIEILKSQSHHVDCQCGRQFTATGAKSKTTGAELLAQLPPRGAESVARWCLHDHARGVLVCRIRNLQVKVAVSGIEPCKLQEGLADMEQLQLPSL